jgi:putative heme-binding domain-containing protein
VQKVLAAFLPSDSTRALVGSALASRSIDRSTQGVVLAALAAAPGTPLHDSWVAPLNDLLHASDDALVTATIQAVAQIKTDKFKDSLKAIGSDTHRPPLVRIAALRAVGGKSGPLEPAAFELLLSQIEVNAPLNNKLEAARVLADAKLTDAQQLAIAPHVATAGPLELPTLLLTFKSYKSEVGKALVANLDKSPGLVSVPISQVKTVLGRFKDDVKDAAAPMMQRLYDQENQKLARMAELEPYLAAGDPARGKVLFDTAKGTCIACHTIKGTGGKVGPDLSQIGRSRQPRDLLESVVVPSASFARGYEPWVVNLTDGTTLMGTIPTDSPDAITFMQVTGVPMQIPRKSIKSMAMSSVSIMPVGLDRTMTPQELADLIAYLKSLQ